jgi:hypothetical protein
MSRNIVVSRLVLGDLLLIVKLLTALCALHSDTCNKIALVYVFYSLR